MDMELYLENKQKSKQRFQEVYYGKRNFEKRL